MVVLPAFVIRALACIQKPKSIRLFGFTIQREVKPLKKIRRVVFGYLQLNILRVVGVDNLNAAGIKIGIYRKLSHVFAAVVIELQGWRNSLSSSMPVISPGSLAWESVHE